MGESSKEGEYSAEDIAYFTALGLNADDIAKQKKDVDAVTKATDEEMKMREEDQYRGLRGGMPDPIE